MKINIPMETRTNKVISQIGFAYINDVCTKPSAREIFELFNYFKRTKDFSDSNLCGFSTCPATLLIRCFTLSNFYL